MTETIILAVIAAELGAIFFAMVAIFVLETYALYLRGNERKGGDLRILTPEELIAHGLNPRDFMNSAHTKAVEPVVASGGQYL